jgi:hypothetical protein
LRCRASLPDHIYGDGVARYRSEKRGSLVDAQLRNTEGLSETGAFIGENPEVHRLASSLHPLE